MFKILNNRLGNKSRCWLCEKPSDGMVTFEDHHIVPKHLGGTNGPLVYLCSDCHTNVHKCAEKLLKGKNNIPYRENSHIEKCLYLANVIVKATLALEKNPINKIYVFSGLLDYQTHEKLIRIVKHLKAPKKRITQNEVIKLAISDLYQKLF